MVHEVSSFEDAKSILEFHGLAVNALTVLVVCEILDTLVIHEKTANTRVIVFFTSRALLGDPAGISG